MKVTKVLFNGDEMVVVSSSEETSQLKKDPPMSMSIGRLDVMRTMDAIGALARRVGRVESVFEAFGGIGWHSRYIQKECRPKTHVVIDLSKDCVRSIRLSKPLRDVRAVQADAFKYKPGRTFEWVHLDFQGFTLARWDSGEGSSRALLDKYVETSSRFVTVTDSAPFGLCRFDQNRNAYVERFGMKMKGDDWSDYWRVLGKAMWKEYRMGAQYVVWWAGQAGCVLFEKDVAPKRKIEVVHCEDKAEIGVISVKEL